MTAPEKLLEQGRQKAKEGKFDEAIACFEQVADADAENADARFYLAGVYYKQGKISQAKQAVKEALRCDPFHEKAAALLQKLQPDRPIQRGESQLPRFGGGLMLIVIIGILIGIYSAIAIHRAKITEEYGRVCGIIYHSLDVEDPITEHWQPWRLVTGTVVLLVVASTIIFPTVLISFAISCAMYAFRFNRWRFSMDISAELGAGTSLFGLAVLLPYLILFVLIIKDLYGPKTYILVGIIALLGVYQLFELQDQAKKKREREG